MATRLLIVGSSPERLQQLYKLVQSRHHETKAVLLNEHFAKQPMGGYLVPKTAIFFPAYASLAEMIEEVDASENGLIWWDKIVIDTDGEGAYTIDLVKLYNQSDCINRPKSVLFLTAGNRVLLEGKPSVFLNGNRLSEKCYQKDFLEAFKNLKFY